MRYYRYCNSNGINLDFVSLLKDRDELHFSILSPFNFIQHLHQFKDIFWLKVDFDEVSNVSLNDEEADKRIRAFAEELPNMTPGVLSLLSC